MLTLAEFKQKQRKELKAFVEETVTRAGSVRKAAKLLDVPNTTLSYYIKNWKFHEARSMHYNSYVQAAADGLSPKETAQRLRIAPGTVYKFCARHPEIWLRPHNWRRLLTHEDRQIAAWLLKTNSSARVWKKFREKVQRVAGRSAEAPSDLDPKTAQPLGHSTPDPAASPEQRIA